jgi:DNA-binding response OmpR family regulator
MPASVRLAKQRDRARRPATVLVVDDEELVREMAATFLSERGYRVIEASSADEAVGVLDSAKPVDVVFTDLRMPGRLDGIGLARWVRDHRPQTRVLITSGCTSLAQQVVEVSNGPLIPKPYRPEDVVQRVRALTVGAGML